jgi:hypothetical protein
LVTGGVSVPFGFDERVATPLADFLAMICFLVRDLKGDRKEMKTHKKVSKRCADGLRYFLITKLPLRTGTTSLGAKTTSLG